MTTIYDECLQSDKALWQSIADAGLSRVCCPKGRQPYTQRPWIVMPDSGRRFREIGSVAVSAVPFTSTDTVVLQFQVPYGYDGVIDTVICGVTGVSPTNFTEGSGDVVWRLSAGSKFQPRLLRDCGNLLFSQGSLITPVPEINSNLRIYSGNLVTFFVSIPVASLVNIASTIVCGCFGWFYSR